MRNIVMIVVALINIGVLISVFFWFLKRLKKIETDLWGARMNLWKEKGKSPGNSESEKEKTS